MTSSTCDRLITISDVIRVELANKSSAFRRVFFWRRRRRRSGDVEESTTASDAVDQGWTSSLYGTHSDVTTEHVTLTDGSGVTESPDTLSVNSNLRNYSDDFDERVRCRRRSASESGFTDGEQALHTPDARVGLILVFIIVIFIAGTSVGVVLVTSSTQRRQTLAALFPKGSTDLDDDANAIWQGNQHVVRVLIWMLFRWLTWYIKIDIDAVFCENVRHSERVEVVRWSIC